MSFLKLHSSYTARSIIHAVLTLVSRPHGEMLETIVIMVSQAGTVMLIMIWTSPTVAQ
jgi:hypothetical protein